MHLMQSITYSMPQSQENDRNGSKKNGAGQSLLRAINPYY